MLTFLECNWFQGPFIFYLWASSREVREFVIGRQSACYRTVCNLTAN